jgi:hypothetical protein
MKDDKSEWMQMPEGPENAPGQPQSGSDANAGRIRSNGRKTFADLLPSFRFSFLDPRGII